jgi:hypothetical protein
MLPVKNEEEMRKRLMSVALKAPQIVFFDNLVEGLSSESLCSAITGGAIADRVLGSTQMVEASFKSVWFATGNHLQIEGDMQRRTLFVNLRAKEDQPHLRSFNTSEDKLLHATATAAPTYAAAAHELVRQFWAAGSPSHSNEKLGSFGAWDALVRSMVVWLGLSDPCSTPTQSREDRFLSKWRRDYGSRAIPAAHIYGHMSTDLPPRALTSVRACGKYLASLEQRRLIEKAGRHATGQQWRIVQ